MSSTYRILCLSHDPAVDLAPEWDSPEPLQWALDTRDPEALDGHAACDLVGGRFSYPLIQVYCPAMTDLSRIAHGAVYHFRGEWTRVEWLHLAYAVQRLNPPGFERILGDVRCWPAARLARLRNHFPNPTPEPARD